MKSLIVVTKQLHKLIKELVSIIDYQVYAENGYA